MAESKKKSKPVEVAPLKEVQSEKAIDGIFIEFDRDTKGRQFLKISVVPEIEEIFKVDPIETSTKYKSIEGDNLKYYARSTRLTDIVAKFNQEGNLITLSDYGTDLYKDGKVNLSILRTVGISKGITIVTENIALDTEINQWIHDLSVFVYFLYTMFIEKRRIQARIIFNIS